MGIYKTVSKARLDAALANGTIEENDITFVKDTENYEGIVVGDGNNPLRFHTVPSPTSQDTEKILQVDNNGIPKWNTIEEKSTFDGSKTITGNLNLGGSLNVTGAVTAQSMTLGSSPTTSSDNMQVPTTAWVNTKLNNKADINSPAFTGTPSAPTPASTDNSTRIATTAFIQNRENLMRYFSSNNENWKYNGHFFNLGQRSDTIHITADPNLPANTPTRTYNTTEVLFEAGNTTVNLVVSVGQKSRTWVLTGLDVGYNYIMHVFVISYDSTSKIIFGYINRLT